MSAIAEAGRVCGACGCTLCWRDCYNCDEDGMVDHDCGEDTCCCLEPMPNVRCDICRGRGGWNQCPSCAPWEE